jgi:threonine/homoserine/homoserine lactone efflux protein
MDKLFLLIRGLLAGVIIAAPVGPVNVLCISRTLRKGHRSGLVSGLGAAAADSIYGAIAGFSISFIIAFLIQKIFWIRFFGGILLMGIGFRYYMSPPRKLESETSGSHRSDFGSALLLNLANPTTVLSFLAVLAGLGLGHQRHPSLTVLLVAGIFAGAMGWWITVVLVTHRLRCHFDDRAMRWMNRVAGLAIGVFGLFTFLLSRR